MKRMDSEDPFPRWLRGAVVALGSFDGFHRGHAALLSRARAIAGSEERPLIVATFDRLPKFFFEPDAPPINLTTLNQCERLFAKSGADALVTVNVERPLGGATAHEMISNWLVNKLGAATILIGQHFVFGSNREGDADTMTATARALGVSVEVVPAQRDRSGEIISSTRIRNALRDGDCATATGLLARPFAVEDVVRHGHKLGRTIGFPTANMLMHDYVRPRYGVYAVRGRLPQGRVIDGVANLGIRPIMEVEEELLETHFFDYTGDLYGQVVEIELIRHMRDEVKLSSFDELKGWIERDCREARDILSDTPHFA